MTFNQKFIFLEDHRRQDKHINVPLTTNDMFSEQATISLKWSVLGTEGFRRATI